MAVVTTSTRPEATQGGSRRSIVTSPVTGRKWMLVADGSVWELWYSDDGNTWSQNTNGTITPGNSNSLGRGATIFCDLDGHLHVAYDDTGTSYRRMANPTSTTSWSAGLLLEPAGNNSANANLVAHREGTGWAAHVVWGYRVASTLDRVTWRPITITSGGTITAGTAENLGFNGSGANASRPPECPIDFRHTGDGVTVATQPDLYLWKTKSGAGLVFQKATYSSGSWTWSAETSVDGTGVKTTVAGYFDGTRCVCVYGRSDGTALYAVERDAANTTTTTRTPPNPSDGTITGVTASHHGGDIYLLFHAGTSRDPKMTVYDRAGNSWSTIETLATATLPTIHPVVTAERHSTNNAIWAAWTDGSASPYDVVAIQAASFNTAPFAPTLTAPIGGATVDRTAQIDLQGTFSDPDAGDQLSEVTIRYRQVGAGSWTEVTQAASGTAFSVPITAGTLTAGDHEWQAKTKDAAGVEGPFSASAFFTAASPPVAPVITAPAGTITNDPSLTEWTAPNQDALQVQTRSAAAGGGTLYHDSGTVVSGTRAYSTPRPVNNRTEYTRVRVRFGGLWSPYAERSDLVAYTPPETPTVVATATPEGWFDIAFTNPAGATTTESNELRRQQSDDGGTTWTDEAGTVDAYNTVAVGIAPAATYTDARKVAHRRLYRWQPVAVGDNGTRAVGAWTT